MPAPISQALAPEGDHVRFIRAIVGPNGNLAHESWRLGSVCLSRIRKQVKSDHPAGFSSSFETCCVAIGGALGATR